MPEFKITGPDGRKFTVKAQDGVDKDAAVNHVIETYYSSAPESRKDLTFMEKVKDSPVGGFARGLRDVVDGGAQLLTRGLEGISPAGSDMEKFFKGERERVEAINNEAERDYQQNFRRGNMEGLDVGRLAGNIASSLPVAAALPMAAATAPMKARVLAGAVSGGASSALQPVMEQDQGDFLENKLGQVAIGGVTGAASPFIADAIGKVVSKFAGKVRGAPSDANITLNLQGEFAKQGIDFSKLSDQVKASMVADAKKALSAGGQLDPEVLARKADFEELGMKPTLGQILREKDPGQFQFEKNTVGIQGAGESIGQRFTEQNAQLIQRLNEMRAGQGLDKFQAAANVIDELKAVDATRNANVGALYDQARAAAGINTPLNPSNFAQSLNNTLDEAMVGDALPAGVRKAINQIATGEMPFTIQKAEQLRQAINGQITNMPSRENFALSAVNRALQNEIDNVGSQAGDEAAQAFKAARAAASERFKQIETSAPLKAAIEGMEPDKFIQKFVINGNAKDLLTLRANLQDNPAMWEEIRGQVIDHLKFEKALNRSADEVGQFSQSMFKKGLANIGDAKLKILFSPDEVAQLKRIARVGEFIDVIPKGAKINNSGTSQAVANLLSRASGVPYLRELVANPIQNFRMQGQVNSALNPSLNAVSGPATLDPELVRRLSLPLSVSGYPTVKGLLE
jgi:hypothetical protein